MDRVKHKWLLLGLALLAVAAIWSGYRYFFAAPDPISQKARQAVRASLKDIELIHGQEGDIVWRLQARASHMSREGEAIFFEKPRLRYFMENGTEVVRAASPQGSLDRDKGRATFWPNVVTRYQDMKLKAGEMTYTANQKQLHFSQGVTARGSDLEIVSQEAVFAVPKRVFIFEGQAKVRMYETPKGK